MKSLNLSEEECYDLIQHLERYRGTSTLLALILERLKAAKPASEVFLTLITWPDGTEGLLFPRPGNVPVPATQEDSDKDFATARNHLIDYAVSKRNKILGGTTIRSVRCVRQETVKEYTL